MPFFQKNYSSDKISALENQGDSRELIKALRHKDPDMRIKAAAALGRVGGTDSVQALVAALESDPMGSVRFFAADSLGKIAGKEAIPSLTTALDNHKGKRSPGRSPGIGRNCRPCAQSHPV